MGNPPALFVKFVETWIFVRLASFRILTFGRFHLNLGAIDLLRSAAARGAPGLSEKGNEMQHSYNTMY